LYPLECWLRKGVRTGRFHRYPELKTVRRVEAGVVQLVSRSELDLGRHLWEETRVVEGRKMVQAVAVTYQYKPD